MKLAVKFAKLTSVALAGALVCMGTGVIAQGAPEAESFEIDLDAPLPPPVGAGLGAGPWDIKTEKADLHVEVVTNGLDTPWSLAFLPEGGMLITERPGHLRVMRDGVLDPKEITGLPDIYALGIAGLMDVQLHPEFTSNELIYISYSKPDPESPQNSVLAVMRAKWDGGYALSEVEDIFVADAWYGKAPVPEKCCGQGPVFGSYGGRILFDDQGYLFITSGDRNNGEMVQKTDNHFGKILRINDDGSIPEDNPWVGKSGHKGEVWTTGHRNPTGLTINPITGEMWDSEFGPRGGDEVNLITRGNNYGWITVTQGFHYDGTPAEGIKDVEGMTDPVLAFGPPSLNPANLAFYRGAQFPEWQGDMLLTTFTKGLRRAEMDENGKAVSEELLLGGLGQRLRDVKIGPDGNIYILTDQSEGALLRITPQK